MIDRDIKNGLLAQVVNAAVRAGAAIMELYDSCESSDDAKRIIGDANQAAQNAIKECLGPTRIPILSEEGRAMLYEERQNWEMFWLVDPLDGTLEFINRNNEFTVNIALMHQGAAIISAIYVPHLQKLYFAIKESGAHLKEGVVCDNNAALSYDQIAEHSQRLPLTTEPRKRQRIALSRSHTTPETLQHIDEIRKANPDVELIEQGSSYKFCMLAEGDVDYYIRTSTTYEWDTAAGELILAEAGGKTTPHNTATPITKLKYNKHNLSQPWFKCHSKHSTIV